MVIAMSDSIPSEVVWTAVVGGLVFAVGLVRIIAGDRARGLDKLIAFGPVCYAAPLAAFGSEHFTLAKTIASFVPSWIPWPQMWTYVIGAGFIAAGFSMVTGILARVSASLVAMTFAIFVAVMDLPAWAQEPTSRLGLTLAMRQLAFCGGALALASSLTREPRRAHILATIARYFVALPVLLYSIEQFLHGDLVPGVPLEPPTPSYVIGHAVWTYLAAAAYAVCGALLLVGRHTRTAATWLGATVVFVVLVVYVPIEVVERTNLGNGFNFFADTLMFGGAVLLLAGAMPRDRN
jgi:uncharacterized membrane protein YphA (DoxX/SURF4 family)